MTTCQSPSKNYWPNLAGRAAELGFGWGSAYVGKVGDVGLKLFKVDPAGLPPEQHSEYAEGLLMLAGSIELKLAGKSVFLKSGDLHIIPAGVIHEIAPGGQGSFLLFDPEPATVR